MRHFHFKYLRNILLVFIALVFAGYPYLLYLIPPGPEGFTRGIIIMIILLLSFGLIAYFAHIEHKKRKKREQEENNITPEEPPSPRGF